MIVIMVNKGGTNPNNNISYDMSDLRDQIIISLMSNLS